MREFLSNQDDLLDNEETINNVVSVVHISMAVSIRFSTVLLFLRLARLHAVSVAFFMFLFGSLLACVSGASFSVARFILGYLILFTAQLSISYSNDYYDVMTDQYSERNFFSGGSKVLVEHPELRNSARILSLVLIVLSVAFAGIFMVLFSVSVFFLLFVILGNLIGWSYSAPPVQLSYRGLGEITTMLVIGFFIPGLGYWVVNGSINGFPLLFSVPFSLYGLALIIDVEVPDREADMHANKKNLIVRKGRHVGLLTSVGALGLASVSFITYSVIIGIYHGIDFGLVFLVSLLPLGTGLYAFFQRNTQSAVLRRSVFLTIASLFLLVLFMDVYLLYLVI